MCRVCVQCVEPAGGRAEQHVSVGLALFVVALLRAAVVERLLL